MGTWKMSELVRSEQRVALAVLANALEKRRLQKLNAPYWRRQSDVDTDTVWGEGPRT